MSEIGMNQEELSEIISGFRSKHGLIEGQQLKSVDFQLTSLVQVIEQIQTVNQKINQLFDGYQKMLQRDITSLEHSMKEVVMLNQEIATVTCYEKEMRL